MRQHEFNGRGICLLCGAPMEQAHNSACYDRSKTSILWPTDAAGRARKAQVEKEVAKALSSAEGSGSEADTEPSGTLEENITEILNGLQRHNYGTAEETLTIATQALLSLYQKELVEARIQWEHEAVNDLYRYIAERKRKKLKGEQP